MGGSNHSKLQQKIIHYLENDDQKKITCLLEKHKIPLYIRLDRCGLSCENHPQEDIYILHIAAARSSKLVLRYLLYQQFLHMIDQRSSTRKTPLMYAVLHDRTELIEIFIDNKAEPNAVDNNGDTALHMACKRRSLALVQELCKFKDININIRNNFDNTARDDAEHLKFWDIVKFLDNKQNWLQADSGLAFGDANTTDGSMIDSDDALLLQDTSPIRKNRINSSEGPKRTSTVSQLTGEPTKDTDRRIDLCDNTRSPAEQRNNNMDQQQAGNGHNSLGDQKQQSLAGHGAMFFSDGLLDLSFANQLTRNYQTMILQLRLDEVLPIMYSKGFFTLHVFQKIKSHKCCSDKIEELLEFLYTVTNEKYLQFIDILMDTKQEALANALRNTGTNQPSSKSSTLTGKEEEKSIFRRTKSDRWRTQDKFSSCVNLCPNKEMDMIAFIDDM